MAILLWLLGVVVFWVVIWVLTRKWQSLGLGLLRAFLRSLAVAFALAPTAISAGYVGFPAPASLVMLSYYAMDRHSAKPDRGLMQNISLAFHCFFVVWIILFLIMMFRFLWVYDHRSTKNA